MKNIASGECLCLCVCVCVCVWLSCNSQSARQQAPAAPDSKPLLRQTASPRCARQQALTAPDSKPPLRQTASKKSSCSIEDSNLGFQIQSLMC